jgi:hypothetical protein
MTTFAEQVADIIDEVASKRFTVFISHELQHSIIRARQYGDDPMRILEWDLIRRFRKRGENDDWIRKLLEVNRLHLSEFARAPGPRLVLERV